MFNNLKQLQILYLYHNNIPSLDSNLFKNLKQLKDLLLDGNQVLTLNGKIISRDEFETILNNSRKKSTGDWISTVRIRWG